MSSPRAIVALIAAPSSYMLLLAFCFVFTAKTIVLSDLSVDTNWLIQLAPVTSIDMTIQFALIALFLAMEASTAMLRLITIPLAACSLCISLVNAAYLVMTGSQLNFITIIVGIERANDAWGILLEEVNRFNPVMILLILGALVALPVGAHRLQQTGSISMPERLLEKYFDRRTLIVLSLSALGLLINFLWPLPNNLSLQQLPVNAKMEIYSSWQGLRSYEKQNLSVNFSGFDPVGLVNPKKQSKSSVHCVT